MPRHSTYIKKMPLLLHKAKDSNDFLGPNYGENWYGEQKFLEANFWEQILGGKFWGANSLEKNREKIWSGENFVWQQIFLGGYFEEQVLEEQNFLGA